MQDLNYKTKSPFDRACRYCNYQHNKNDLCCISCHKPQTGVEGFNVVMFQKSWTIYRRPPIHQFICYACAEFVEPNPKHREWQMNYIVEQTVGLCTHK